MKYLCLAYYDTAKFSELDATALQALSDQCRPLDERLQASGYLVAQASLQEPGQTMMVRARNGQSVVVDGPFAETKEQIGGFFIVEARDLNEALMVAAMHPAGQLNEHLGWAVEVRPIEHFMATT